MPKYNVTEIQTNETKRRSEFVYANGQDRIVRQPAGQGAPKSKITENGKDWSLVEILRYLPAAAPVRPAKVKAEPVTKDSIKRTTVSGPSKQVVLVYSDGSEVVAGGGRPRYTHKDTGAALVEIRTVVPGKTKGTKGRAKTTTEIVEVEQNPRTEYLYGDKLYPGTGKRGAPPKMRDGKELVKIIKYVLGKTKPEPKPQEEERPFVMPVSKLIPSYPVGTVVQYNGNTYKVYAVPSSDYFLPLENLATGFRVSAEEKKVKVA